jgi:hypothetical protein
MIRWRLQLKSQNGTIPPILFEGTTTINGRNVKATYAINPDKSVRLVTIPEVDCDWQKGEIKVNCDPNDLTEILGNIERKAHKNGLSFNVNEVLTKNNQPIKIENPEIKSGFVFDLHAFTPCFLKMALATGHKVLGYAWSSGKDAELIRNAMWESDPKNRVNHKIKGSVWPNAPSSLKQVFFLGQDRHIIIVLNTNPVSFYAMLFGEFEGVIQLQEGIWDGPGLAPLDGRIFIIDCKTRKLEELGLGEFVIRRSSGAYPT